MIRVSENSKKRFNITNKFFIYQKQLELKNNSNYDYEKFFNNYLKKKETKLNDYQKRYNELSSKKNTSKSALLLLSNKISVLQSELEEINQLSNRKLQDESVEIKNVKYAAKTIRLGGLYKIDKIWQKILIIIALSVILSCSVWLLVQYTGIYTPGLSGIIQGLSKIVKLKIEQMGPEYIYLSNVVYNIMFWILYFVINIPLIIFAYYKIGKQFAILSAIFIVFSQITGLCLGFINDGHGIYIFTNMDPDKLANMTMPLEYIPGIQMIPWNTGNGIIMGIFIYSFISSIFGGIIYSSIYILGASTGGTDFIGFYYSKVKNKSIANLLTTFNVVSLILGALLGSFVCWLIKAVTPQYNEVINLKNPTTILGSIFSPNLVASIFGAITSGILYNYYFPRNKVIKVQIYSKKANEIATSLNLADWNYKLLVSESKEDVLNENQGEHSLETICVYIDIPMLISTIRSIDSEGLITIYSTFGFDGELPTTSYER